MHAIDLKQKCVLLFCSIFKSVFGLIFNMHYGTDQEEEN